ncbi:Oidioi.mRNA.OKI2018_I69.chr1.g3384.t1.cds [Oikopleura dioica]|uniref:Oidioi.mRNA.OKI2018_I69.chr1.g3384.t1.cds n=1 Tax=Oikopleura dioica TaxID=34765 RepID=A0ABN7SVN7_OIKDI|nr:Oidioi.mRNA.OKI2018_I69.chr1.g3384.t1.cds [Oikopleura dioica]
MKVREFQKKDPDQAYAIWKHGMSVDLTEQRIDWIFNLFHVRLILLALPLVVLYCGYGTTPVGFLYAIVPSGLLIAFLRYMVHYTLNGYVATRTDMLNIQKHHGKRFLVAENEDGEIIGTVAYSEKTKISTFKGERIGKKTWEMFSMSVKKEARRLGVANKMLAELEKRARGAKIQNIVFTATTPQVPAVIFYRKCGYDFEFEDFPALDRGFIGAIIADCFFKFCKMNIIKFHKEI